MTHRTQRTPRWCFYCFDLLKKRHVSPSPEIRSCLDLQSRLQLGFLGHISALAHVFVVSPGISWWIEGFKEVTCWLLFPFVFVVQANQILGSSPIALMKAVKNSVELEGIREASVSMHLQMPSKSLFLAVFKSTQLFV